MNWNGILWHWLIKSDDIYTISKYVPTRRVISGLNPEFRRKIAMSSLHRSKQSNNKWLYLLTSPCSANPATKNWTLLKSAVCGLRDMFRSSVICRLMFLWLWWDCMNCDKTIITIFMFCRLNSNHFLKKSRCFCYFPLCVLCSLYYT